MTPSEVEARLAAEQEAAHDLGWPWLTGAQLAAYRRGLPMNVCARHLSAPGLCSPQIPCVACRSRMCCSLYGRHRHDPARCPRLRRRCARIMRSGQVTVLDEPQETRYVPGVGLVTATNMNMDRAVAEVLRVREAHPQLWDDPPSPAPAARDPVVYGPVGLEAPQRYTTADWAGLLGPPTGFVTVLLTLICVIQWVTAGWDTAAAAVAAVPAVALGLILGTHAWRDAHRG
jgi:hypothetical protein